MLLGWLAEAEVRGWAAMAGWGGTGWSSILLQLTDMADDNDADDDDADENEGVVDDDDRDGACRFVSELMMVALLSAMAM